MKMQFLSYYDKIISMKYLANKSMKYIFVSQEFWFLRYLR